MSTDVLVLGDSYACLDDTHSHWATMWAQSQDLTVEHQGYPGASHVHIINSFLSAGLPIAKHIIYHVTDFLRADITTQSDNTDNILEFYNKSEHISMEKLYLDAENRHRASTNRQNSDTDQFYNSIYIPWLARANMFACDTLINRCKQSDTQLTLVLWPGIVVCADNFPDSDIFEIQHDISTSPNRTPKNDSINHLTKSEHRQICTQFHRRSQ
jgi:hypothetical protein